MFYVFLCKFQTSSKMNKSFIHSFFFIFQTCFSSFYIISKRLFLILFVPVAHRWFLLLVNQIWWRTRFDWVILNCHLHLLLSRSCLPSINICGAVLVVLRSTTCGKCGPPSVVIGQMVTIGAKTFAIVQFFGVSAGPCPLFRLHLLNWWWAWSLQSLGGLGVWHLVLDASLLAAKMQFMAKVGTWAEITGFSSELNLTYQLILITKGATKRTRILSSVFWFPRHEHWKRLRRRRLLTSHYCTCGSTLLWFLFDTTITVAEIITSIHHATMAFIWMILLYDFISDSRCFFNKRGVCSRLSKIFHTLFELWIDINIIFLFLICCHFDSMI